MSHWKLDTCKPAWPSVTRVPVEKEGALDALMLASSAAYTDFSTTNKTTDAWTAKLPKVSDVQVLQSKASDGMEHTQALAFKLNDTDDACVVAFRGTNNIQNWVDDLSNGLVDVPWHPSGQAHKGFLRAYTSLQDQVHQYVSNCKSVSFTGHSLGGAMAQLAASDVAATKTTNVATVVTFESPMVFDRPMAKEYNAALGEQTLHVTQAGDGVPHYPPGPRKFQRTGTELYYKEDECKACDPSKLLSNLQCSALDRPSIMHAVDKHCNYTFGAGTQNLCGEPKYFTTLSSPTNMTKSVSSL